MTDKFVTLYEPDVPTWSSIESLNEALNWTELVSQTGAEYFQSNGISQKFATEIIEAATRVNYAQVSTLLCRDCSAKPLPHRMSIDYMV